MTQPHISGYHPRLTVECGNETKTIEVTLDDWMPDEEVEQTLNSASKFRTLCCLARALERGMEVLEDTSVVRSCKLVQRSVHHS